MATFQKGQTNYDLFAPEYLFNPYQLYKQIRSEDPVYFYKKGGLWLLTRYQDVEAAFQDLAGIISSLSGSKGSNTH